MISFLYTFGLSLLSLLLLPKFLIDCLFKKKYRKSLHERLFPKPLRIERKKVIWLHGVSVGEIKALATLIPHIRKNNPETFLLVTTITETGKEEARRSIPDIDAIYYLPLDFPWIIRPFIKKIHPDLLILVEGDYWFHCLDEVKKRGGKIVTVSGKLSKKSLKHYLISFSFTRKLFSKIDHFCLQGESHLEKFLKLGILAEKLTVMGNLKYDIPLTQTKNCDLLKQIQPSDQIITLGSTHKGEEALLIKTLLPLLEKNPHLKLLVVPRHPERFKKIKNGILHSQIHVVDQMGILSSCYAVSTVAIVGGSFVKGIGGHNLFEPVKMGIPTLYGPYVDKQVDLDRQLSKSGASQKLPIEKLSSTIEKILTDPKSHLEMQEKGKQFAQKTCGCSFRTWNFIQSNISLEKNS